MRGREDVFRPANIRQDGFDRIGDDVGDAYRSPQE